MKIAELREMKIAELHVELDRMRRNLFELRAQSVTEKLENPHRMTDVKHDIARVLTVLRERGETGIEEKQHHMESAAARSRRG